MPTYEYECKNCSHRFEVFQSMNDSPLKDCPECGREVRRLIFGGTGVIFKGSGFYVTDKGKTKSGVASAKSTDQPQKTESGSSGNTAPEKSPSSGGETQKGSKTA